MFKYTRVEYMYRDASNYKFQGDFIVAGLLTIGDLEEYLFDGEFFIPHEVGLTHLLNLPMNEDDHYLHTLETFVPTDSGDPVCQASELVIRFQKANERGWFSSLKN